MRRELVGKSELHVRDVLRSVVLPCHAAIAEALHAERRAGSARQRQRAARSVGAMGVIELLRDEAETGQSGVEEGVKASERSADSSAERFGDPLPRHVVAARKPAASIELIVGHHASGQSERRLQVRVAIASDTLGCTSRSERLPAPGGCEEGTASSFWPSQRIIVGPFRIERPRIQQRQDPRSTASSSSGTGVPPFFGFFRSGSGAAWRAVLAVLGPATRKDFVMRRGFWAGVRAGLLELDDVHPRERRVQAESAGRLRAPRLRGSIPEHRAPEAARRLWKLLAGAAAGAPPIGGGRSGSPLVPRLKSVFRRASPGRNANAPAALKSYHGWSPITPPPRDPTDAQPPTTSLAGVTVRRRRAQRRQGGYCDYRRWSTI